MNHENHGDDTIIPTSAPVLPDSIPSDHLTCMQVLPEDYVKEHGIPAGNTVPCLPDKSKPSWHATFQTRTKWENGRQLTVKFLGASPHPSDTVKNKVKQYALLWEKYANIKFVFVESGNADIRVSFNRKGSWSFIGKDCLNITDQSQPTMNFGWLDDSTSEAEYQRVVCHEFGHALGASHEQQNPNVHIDWNKPAVYEYYAKPENGGWSQQTTDINMFTPVVGAEATQWDPTSIMQYRILPGWTFDGFSVGVNGVISAQDASFMQTMYPQFQDDQGTWNTLSTGSIQQPSYQATIMYNPPKTNLPWLGLGINYIDHLILDPVAVSVWADDESTAGFDLHIDGYPTTIFAAGATWLEFDPTEFPNVEVNSVGFSYPSPAPRENQFHVAFRHAYTNPPRVFVWLNSFAIEQGKSWCMGADVSDITKTGCTISISTLTADTGMLIGNVTYMVYPADMAGIETGIVKVGDPGTGGGPAHIQPQTNKRPVTFQTAFRSRPKVFMAITALDFQNNFNMRLDTYVDNVSEEGFTAHMNSWIDNSMYGVTCSWIALKS